MSYYSARADQGGGPKGDPQDEAESLLRQARVWPQDQPAASPARAAPASLHHFKTLRRQEDALRRQEDALGRQVPPDRRAVIADSVTI